MTETILLPGFGDIDAVRIIAFDDLFAVIQDQDPVSPGHTLIVVRRLASRFQELTSLEKTRLLTCIDWTQHHLATNLSGSFLPPRPSPAAMPLAGENGLSYRANRCLLRAGVPAEKSAVVPALNIGALQPGQRIWRFVVGRAWTFKGFADNPEHLPPSPFATKANS